MTPLSAKDLARRVDYTLFAPNTTRRAMEQLCAEAQEHSYHSIAVNGSQVELARALLDESTIQVVALVGFPLGANDSDAKRYETEIAVDHGAHEIDFVINVGQLKDGNHQYVLRELRDIAEAADERPVKAIIETHLLTREERITACKLALDSGVKFISTATDFQSALANADDIKLLSETVGDALGVKVSGGIRDAGFAQTLLDAGATRLGISAGVSLWSSPAK